MTAHTGNRCGICGSMRHGSALHAHALADGVRLAQAGAAGGPLPPEPGPDACAARAGEPPGGKSAVGPDAATLLTRLREKTLGCEGFGVGKENAEEISSGAAVSVLSGFAPVTEAELRELRASECRFAPVYGGGPINTSDVLTDEEDAGFGPTLADVRAEDAEIAASFVGAEIDMGPPVVLGAERITEADLRAAPMTFLEYGRWAAGRGLRRAIEGVMAEEARPDLDEMASHLVAQLREVARQLTEVADAALVLRRATVARSRTVGEDAEGGRMPLDVAIAVIVDTHTADDAVRGFIWGDEPLREHDMTAYCQALRALRQHLGRRVDPGQYPPGA